MPRRVGNLARARAAAGRTGIGGTPTKKTPETVEKILQLLRLGCPIRSACGAAGISPECYMHWCDVDDNFFAATEKAKADFVANNVANITAAARKGGQWTASAWLLERRMPEEFGRIDRHLIQAQHSGTMQLRAELDSKSDSELLNKIRDMSKYLDAGTQRAVKDTIIGLGLPPSDADGAGSQG